MSDNSTITYSYEVVEIRTATVNTMTNVIKKMTWRITGASTLTSETFTLNGDTYCPDPDPVTFIPFENLDEVTVGPWIEQHTDPIKLQAIKDHVDIIMNKYIVDDPYDKTDLPWKPPSTLASPHPDTGPPFHVMDEINAQTYILNTDGTYTGSVDKHYYNLVDGKYVFFMSDVVGDSRDYRPTPVSSTATVSVTTAT
jgi:hypothetical protein